MIRASAESELLSTGQTAARLGSSRQHVVDMCERGELSFVWAGSHRRIPRAAIERLLGGAWTRDQERSLWLHRAIAGRAVLNPDAVLDRARRNVERLSELHTGGMTARYLDQWRVLLDDDLDALLDMLTSRTPQAIELRQNSPFSGVLSEEERQACLAAFRSHWRREHAA